MKHTLRLALLTTLVASTVISCTDHNIENPGGGNYLAKATFKTAPVLSTMSNGTKIYGSGYGSSMAQVPGEWDSFYLMTDRGPNVDGTNSAKIFPAPDFNPHIAKFKLVGDELVYQSSVAFKNAAGMKLTGRPNLPGEGNAGETALDFTGAPIANDPEGIDCEGLAVDPTDGTFWVSDEYGPHIVHFDKSGKTIERINPFGTGTGGRKLPKVLARRRPNRGMEGLTISPDGKFLVGMMQSPIYNPSKTKVANSRVLRLVVFNIASGETKQYVFLTESTKTLSSEIVAITGNTFLVLERDQDYAGGNPASLVKRVYKIDISAATDISDPENKESGLLFGGKTVDEMTDPELTTNNIKPVIKELVADILAIPGGYAHDKAEGLVIINNNMIAVVNDDDFGIVSPETPDNSIIQKILPSTMLTDQNVIYFIPLSKGLK